MFASLSNLPLARRWQGQKHPIPSVVALIRRDSSANSDEPEPHYLLIQRQADLQRFSQTEAALLHFEADVIASSDENALDELQRFEPGP